MQRLDSIKIQLPLEGIKINNFACFGNIPKSRLKRCDNVKSFSDLENNEDIEIESNQLFLLSDFNNGKKLIGLNNITFNTKSKKLIFEISAKILKDNYHKGINLNTFDQAITEINKTGIISMPVDLVLKEGHFLKLDSTFNLEMQNNPDNYITALKGLENTSEKWIITKYPHEGILIKKNVISKGYRLSLVFYIKHIELLKAENKDLRGLLSKQSIDYYKDNNVLRVEAGFDTKTAIKQYFKVNNYKVKTILETKKNPVSEVFNVLSKDINYDITPSFNNFSDRLKYLTGQGIAKETLAISLNELKLIEKDRQKRYRQAQKLKEAYFFYQNNKGQNKIKFDMINELKEKLKNCV